MQAIRLGCHLMTATKHRTDALLTAMCAMRSVFAASARPWSCNLAASADMTSWGWCHEQPPLTMSDLAALPAAPARRGLKRTRPAPAVLRVAQGGVMWSVDEGCLITLKRRNTLV